MLANNGVNNKVESLLKLAGLTDRCLKKQSSIKKIFEFKTGYQTLKFKAFRSRRRIKKLFTQKFYCIEFSKQVN